MRSSSPSEVPSPREVRRQHRALSPRGEPVRSPAPASSCLKGGKSLDENGQAALERIKSISSDLTDAYILKERLRTIYATAKDGYDACCLLRSWCSMAEATQIPEVMASFPCLKICLKRSDLFSLFLRQVFATISVCHHRIEEISPLRRTTT